MNEKRDPTPKDSGMCPHGNFLDSCEVCQKEDEETAMTPEQVWQNHLRKSTKQYKAERADNLKELESSNFIKQTKEYYFKLNRTLKRLLRKDATNELKIEEDPQFMDFLITSARDFSIILDKYGKYRDNPTRKGLCKQTAVPFAGYLNNLVKERFPTSGAEAVFVTGRFHSNAYEHWWVQVGSTIADVTPRQFQVHPKMDASIKEAVRNNTTEEGVFISNDKNNPLYQQYHPSIVMRTSDEWSEDAFALGMTKVNE